MLKYKCSNNPSHIFEKPTEDFWCSICDISTKPMLIPFKEENKIDITPNSIEIKDDSEKTIINTGNESISDGSIYSNIPLTSPTNTEENIVIEQKIEPKQETIDADETNEEKIHHEEITIGNQIWMKNFFSNTEFSNGDKIAFAKNEREWKKLNDKKIPAWTYASDSESSKKHGVLYNFYAINNISGLAPEGWKIPSLEDINELKVHQKYSFINEHVKRFNQSKLHHILPSGSKIEANNFRIFWINNEKFYTAAALKFSENDFEIKRFDKGAGFFVRCIKENDNL
jgi:uncharacterized protein (TIGR02145 family)